MGKSDLIKRYIEAGTMRLKGQEKEKGAQKLEDLIEKKLSNQYGDQEPTDEVIKQVLFELGSPSRLLVQNYESDTDKGRGEVHYYIQYKRILKKVLPLVVFFMSVIWIVGVLTQPSVKWYTEMGRWIGMTLSGVVGTFAMITLVVAVFEANHIELDFIDTKPSSLKKQRDFSRGEAFFGILAGSLFLIVFLRRPEIFSGIFEGGKEIIPLFNIAFIRESWAIILAIGGLSLLKEVYRFVYARYNIPVLLITLVSSGGMVVLMTSWLRSGQLFNQAFIGKILELFKEEKVELMRVFEHLQEIVLMVVLFGSVIEIVVTIIKTFIRGNKK